MRDVCVCVCKCCTVLLCVHKFISNHGGRCWCRGILEESPNKRLLKFCVFVFELCTGDVGVKGGVCEQTVNVGDDAVGPGAGPEPTPCCSFINRRHSDRRRRVDQERKARVRVVEEFFFFSSMHFMFLKQTLF